MNDLIDFQAWASGFYLKRPLTREELCCDTTSWFDFDQLIQSLEIYPEEPGFTWNRIANLAEYTYQTRKEICNDYKQN